MCSSFSRSPCIILDTGMPVARDTTSAISSAPTRVRNRRGRPSSPSASVAASAAPISAAFRRASRSGSLPYCSSASLSNWPLRCSSAISARTPSISFLDGLRALHGGLFSLPDFLEVVVLALQLFELVLDHAQAALGGIVGFS